VFGQKWSFVSQELEMCLIKNALIHEIVHEEGDFISICNMLDLKTFNKFS